MTDHDERIDESTDLIRCKGLLDGAETLTQAAGRLEEYAATLRRLEGEGWQLTGPVEDDYGWIRQVKA